ncbi:MAG: septation protein SepH [Marmoricola sp.]
MNAVSDAARLPEAGAELTPLRISRDHSHLVVIDGDGNEYTIPLGQQLQTQTQPSQTQHSQTSPSEQKVETPMTSGPTESALRPRDIQQRIRAGMSLSST